MKQSQANAMISENLSKRNAEEIIAMMESISSENCRLREVLEKLEWYGTSIVGYFYAFFCPACRGHKQDGHKPDCWLAKALEEK